MYIFKNGKRLRCGYTTGLCAAAASKAAVEMLLFGNKISEISVSKEFFACRVKEDVVFSLENINITDDAVICAVRKDAGDDIDVTDGLLICAKAERSANMQDIESGDSGRGLLFKNGKTTEGEQEEAKVIIKGGEGVGRVTMPGLDQPVGETAINSGPRRMIEGFVKEVCKAAGYRGGIDITIFVPEGEKAAQETFNPILGIKGGISILGTTGIVEPMSTSAVIETIKAEISVKSKASDYLTAVPGNYGMEFVTVRLGISESRIIKCSNYIGDAIDSFCENGIKGILLAGNLGKFVKLAGGIFNTHSRNADCRLDILIRCALKAGAPADTLLEIDKCVTTDAAVEILKKREMLKGTMRIVITQAEYYVKRRCGSGLEAGIIIFANDKSVLCRTDNAEELCRKLRNRV